MENKFKFHGEPNSSQWFFIPKFWIYSWQTAEEVEDIVIDLASEETEELAADDHEDVLEDDMIVEAIEEEELEEKIEELKEVIEENNPDHEQESATH